MSDHVWVSMETDGIDRWRFGSVVALSDDALVRGARGLMPLPDGDYGRRAEDTFESPCHVCEQSRGRHVASTWWPPEYSDETFPASQDESGDKANLRDRLSIRSPTDEENLGAREPPDDLLTLWIEYDAHGDRHKAWRDFTREATFEIHKGWPFDDGRSALLYMVKHFEKTWW